MFGMLSEVSALQLKKASEPIAVTEVGNVMLVILKQSEKAPSPIFVTVEGIVYGPLLVFGYLMSVV